MKKIVFYEVFEEEREALERHLAKDLYVQIFAETVQEREAQGVAADIVSIRTQSVLSTQQAEHVSGILTRSTGYDHVMTYVQQGICCGYLPLYCSRAVAEQAIIMTQALWRRLPQQMYKVFDFCRDGLTGQESYGKNVLVVGVGKIGMECVRIAEALGMNVKGVDIAPRERSVKYVPLKKGLPWADAVVVAVPLTEKTNNMFSQKTFRMMKKEAIFVNISRGEVSPLDDIEWALKKGLVAGAGLDVYDHEADLAAELRQNPRSPMRERFKNLSEQYNMILTPHNAFNTKESVERKAQQSAMSIEHFLNEGIFLDNVLCR